MKSYLTCFLLLPKLHEKVCHQLSISLVKQLRTGFYVSGRDNFNIHKIFQRYIQQTILFHGCLLDFVLTDILYLQTGHEDHH